MNKYIVSVDWLQEHINDQDLILLDASISKVTDKTATQDDTTIKGARFFDLKNKFVNKEAPFPNTVPSPQQFELECQKLGINQNSTVVIFDNIGIYSSPRAWWLFRAMGHDKVVVLNGGLPAWKEANGTIEVRTLQTYSKGNFKAKFNSKLIKNYQDVLQNNLQPSFTIVDARSAGRFKGIAPEPRKQLKSGQIPQSINIPYTEVLEGIRFKSKTALEKIFQEKENIISDDFVFSCGSGLTACIIMLAYAIAHKEHLYLYDGSWTEWATLQGLNNSI